jgi:hypothetical protein
MQVRGQLSRTNLPFYGQSSAKVHFQQPVGAVRPVKILPFDMMVVPHSMKMDLKTTASG